MRVGTYGPVSYYYGGRSCILVFLRLYLLECAAGITAGGPDRSFVFGCRHALFAFHFFSPLFLAIPFMQPAPALVKGLFYDKFSRR